MIILYAKDHQDDIASMAREAKAALLTVSAAMRFRALARWRYAAMCQGAFGAAGVF